MWQSQPGFADAAVIRSASLSPFRAKSTKRSSDSAADLMDAGTSWCLSAVSCLQEIELTMGHEPREKFKRLSAKN